ncbi:60s ribosomal protein l29-2, partial [Nicotiana attenuata]
KESRIRTIFVISRIRVSILNPHKNAKAVCFFFHFLLSRCENPSAFSSSWFVKWPSPKITQLTTSRTRPTGMASRSQESTAIHLPKGWILSS